MKRQLTVLTIVLSLLTFGLGNLDASAAPARRANSKTVNITGTANGAQVFTGTFTVTRFTHKGNQLLAEGTLKGTLTKPSSGDAHHAAVPQEINQQVTMPARIAKGTCEILSLQLGPLDLDLLGLRVQLSQVNLDITAEPGSGNLLGNLLCAVAKLLDGPGVANAIGRIVNLLNQILNALG